MVERVSKNAALGIASIKIRTECLKKPAFAHVKENPVLKLISFSSVTPVLLARKVRRHFPVWATLIGQRAPPRMNRQEALCGRALRGAGSTSALPPGHEGSSNNQALCCRRSGADRIFPRIRRNPVHLTFFAVKDIVAPSPPVILRPALTLRAESPT